MTREDDQTMTGELPPRAHDRALRTRDQGPGTRDVVTNSPSIHTSSTSTRAPDTMDGPTCGQPADPKLWTVHVHGPDDLITFVDPDVAHALAAQLNALSAEILTDPLDPNVTAHVIPPDNTTDHDQPSDQQSDEHFPWHYTEYGVVCACGQPMRDEICPASPATDRQPCDQQSRPVTSVSVREAGPLSRPVVSSGSRVGLDLDAIEEGIAEESPAVFDDASRLVAEVRRLRAELRAALSGVSPWVSS